MAVFISGPSGFDSDEDAPVVPALAIIPHTIDNALHAGASELRGNTAASSAFQGIHHRFFNLHQNDFAFLNGRSALRSFCLLRCGLTREFRNFSFAVPVAVPRGLRV